MIDARQVVECQEGQIADLKKKVAGLEEIAVPSAEAAKAPEPIYEALRSNETTHEFPLPQTPTVVTLAKAELVDAL